MFNQKEILKLASFLIICNLLVQPLLGSADALENKSTSSKILRKSSLKSNANSNESKKLPVKEHAEGLFPGIYISDTENRWHVSEYKHEEGEQFGYVICRGAYIGSPLIPNDKVVVDKFLDYCKSNKKIGPGNLPVIDVASNHSAGEESYKAYKVSLGGRNLFLCRGYLNSTDKCSYEGDKLAMSMMSRIKKGLPLDSQPQIVETIPERQNPQQSLSESSSIPSKPEVFSLDARPLAKEPLKPLKVDSSKMALTEEIAREISSTLTPSNSSLPLSGATKVKFEAIPLSSLSAEKSNEQAPRTLQITAEEFEALKSGRITLADLTERSANNSSVASVGLGNVPLESSKKAIQITSSELEALQNGRISLEQLVASKPLVDVNSSAQTVLAQSSPQAETVKKGLQVTATEAEDLRAGRITIEQLLSNRSLVDLNSPGVASSTQPAVASPLQLAIPPVVNGINTAGAQVLPISPEALAALQNGSMNVNQVMQGASSQTVNLGNQNPLIVGANPSSVQSQQLQPNVQQIQNVAASQYLPQQILQQPVQITNMQMLPISQPQLVADPGAGNFVQNYPQMQQQVQQFAPQQLLAQPQQMQAMAEPSQVVGLQSYAIPQQNPQFMNVSPQMQQEMPFAPNQIVNGANSYPQNYAPEANPQIAYQNAYDQNNGVQINGPQGAIPDYGNVSYQDYYEQPAQNGVSYAPLAWSGYYFNQRYYGPPMTYATNAIYGTHSNTVYWPGMRGSY